MTWTSAELESALDRGQNLVGKVRREVGRVIVGQEEVIDGLLVALLAGGHVLVEGVPGLGKTLLVRTLAASLGLDFNRIQCTPDLMPADVLGTRILSEDGDGRRRLELQPGPVFTQVLLADEINRATPKTQSALLEAMQESAVTLSGERRILPDPFFMMATQNPVEMEGTFPLPEAQLDRFLLKLLIRMPALAELSEIVDRTTGGAHIEAQPVAEKEEVLELRRAVREVLIPEPVKDFALRLVVATNPEGPEAPEAIRRYVRYGSSPRGAQAIVLAAKVRAALDGRPNAGFEDVHWAAVPALAHRLVPSYEGEAEGMTGEQVLGQVFEGLQAEVGVAS